MGTLNHFAKDAGIPLNLEAAVRNAFSGRCAVVDVGEVNGRVFVNNSGIGLYPRFVRLSGKRRSVMATPSRWPSSWRCGPSCGAISIFG